MVGKVLTAAEAKCQKEGLTDRLDSSSNTWFHKYVKLMFGLKF